MLKEKYSKGRYLLRTDLPYSENVREFIVSLSFKQQEQTRLVEAQDGRKRNSLYTFYFPAAQKNMVLKVSQISPEYSQWRRMELFLVSLFRDYNKRAFLGSIAMENAGVNTGRPVAFWTYNTSFFTRISYYMYEKIESDFKMYEYQQMIGSAPAADQRYLADCMVERAIVMLKQLSAKGIRHGDPHVGNFLVELPVKEGKADIQIVARNMKLYLIDNDHVSIARVRLPWIKHVFDLKALRRIRLDDKGRKYFLKRYLGENYREVWWWVIEFWAGGGFKIHRWLRQNKKIA